MSNELSKEVREEINRIPWDQLKHAYGGAKDAPHELENLFSHEEVYSSNAYYDWLMSAVFHQYTMYSATPGAIAVVLCMLKTMDVANLMVAEKRADKQLLYWLSICAESCLSYPEVKNALLKGKAVYCNFINSPNHEVVQLANKLCEWCNEKR